MVVLQATLCLGLQVCELLMVVLQATLGRGAKVFELLVVVSKFGSKSVILLYEFFAHSIHTVRNFQDLFTTNRTL
jgi:hypothetical protein